MKNLTLGNYARAVEMVTAKGYSEKDAQEMAINAISVAQSFGMTVEAVIAMMEEVTK